MHVTKINNPNIERIFTTVTFETETEREESKTVYGKYPYGQGLGFFAEIHSRSIQQFTAGEKLSLKTIIAHICEIGNEIAKTSQSIFLCQKAISHFKSSKEIHEEELRSQFCAMQERLLAIDEPKKNQLLITMGILAALLIKESYEMDQKTRGLIINFLCEAKVLAQLDKISSLTRVGMGFTLIYFDSMPLLSSGLQGISIPANTDEKIPYGFMIPICSFKSSELKPKALPLELEALWPLPV